ncbi:MAG TPA: stage V sporulation protein AD [Firmicutes bacterium]|nr:stage V sporulation protein AD [Bacillota bacterium]
MTAVPKRMGNQTVGFSQPPRILSVATVAGPREGAGPMGSLLDLVVEDTLVGCKTWEQAEASMLESAVNLCLKKANMSSDKVQFLIAGDLLNQIVSSSYMARQVGIPFIGIYGACSTVSEGIALAAMIIDGGFADYVLVATSSHHNTAERQYRYPTEFGNQRPPTAQWTVTGAAAILLTSQVKSGPMVTSATVGKVLDMGIKDPNDMGSAMAPAAADTIHRHLTDTGRRPQDYNAILTGDLGMVGKKIAGELLRKSGLDLDGILDDCGLKIYSGSQDPHSGASGCACSGLVLGCSLWPQLASGSLRRVLLVATGALHSPLSVQQGESIPSVAHAVCLEG